MPVREDGDTTLDLGCGIGRLLKAFPNVNVRYTGIDNNEFLLTAARKEFPGKEFQQMSMEALALGDQQYDYIFCIAAFHHLVCRTDRLVLLQKCHAALQPDGTLFMTVWDLWQPKYVRHVFSHLTLKVAWNDFFIPWKATDKIVWRYYHGFTKGELRRLLRAAGFTHVEVMRAKGEKGWGFNYVVRASR